MPITRPANDAKRIETEMIGELAHVTGATLVGPVRVERAVAITGPVNGDQAHLLPSGYVGKGFDVAV